MNQLVSQAVSILLEGAVVLFSDDPAKADMEVTCVECGALICDVESGDSLAVLAMTGLDHLAGHADGTVG